MMVRYHSMAHGGPVFGTIRGERQMIARCTAVMVYSYQVFGDFGLVLLHFSREVALHCEARCKRLRSLLSRLSEVLSFV